MKCTERLPAIAFVLSLAFLAFSAGVLVSYYKLPPYRLYEEAIFAAEAVIEKQRSIAAATKPSEKQNGEVMQESKGAYHGYTLIASEGDTRVILVDMQGKVAHEWNIPYEKLHPNDEEKPLKTYVVAAYLYPNGDLLAVYNKGGVTPYGGDLVKMDRDSNLIWITPGQYHHDITVGKDGTLYTLSQEYVDSIPEMIMLRYPVLEDYLEILSPEGKSIKRIPLMEAFNNTSFKPFLFNSMMGNNIGDVLHSNSVMPLEADMAEAFPRFKAGNVLVSLRNQSLIVMIDPESGKVVWAQKGAWSHQHAARLQKNGRIVMLDNQGYFNGRMVRSRLLEVNPNTQAMPWSYVGTIEHFFYSKERGNLQPLPNGNLLAMQSDTGEAFEITREREIVWQYKLKNMRCAIRYGADELPFLKP